MTAAEPATVELRIGTAADLLAAVGSDDESVREAALLAIRESPEAALGLGRAGGWDVVDALIHHVYQPTRYRMWHQTVAALTAFDDPRVVDVCLKLLGTSQQPATLELVAERLGREPIEPHRERYEALLCQDRSPAHARAVAPLLRDAPLAPDAAFRRDLLLGTASLDDPAPALALLGGPFEADVRPLLEAAGESAFVAVRERWAVLSASTRRWALGWGTRAWPARAVDALIEAFADPALSDAAEACLAEYAGAEWLFERYRGATRQEPGG